MNLDSLPALHLSKIILHSILCYQHSTQAPACIYMTAYTCMHRPHSYKSYISLVFILWRLLLSLPFSGSAVAVGRVFLLVDIHLSWESLKPEARSLILTRTTLYIAHFTRSSHNIHVSNPFAHAHKELTSYAATKEHMYCSYIAEHKCVNLNAKHNLMVGSLYWCAG